ncbi:MAG: hypothetical protein JRG91_00080 [Deltaproteobacteria bacterium]|nr:hypothetical protein [Deltaproteobacteria bacterium]
MADDKKKPAGADIDDLKARLGLKKPGAGGAQPAAPAPPGFGPPPGMGAPPGVAPGGAPPPAFMQQPQKPVDVTKDPFAPQLGVEVQRPSLVGETRPSLETVSAEDQKASAKRNALITAVVAIMCIAVGFGIGSMLGNGCSQRKLRQLAVADGSDLYGLVQNGSKKLAEMKKAVVASRGKAAKMEFDAASIAKLKDHTKKDNPPPMGLSEVAKRNYQIYTGETVPVLFTYTSSWQELYRLVRQHVARSENDRKALKAWKGKFEKVASSNYGIILSKEPFGEEAQALVGNLVLVTQPFDPSVMEYQIQFDVGTPVSEDFKPAVYLEGSGDIAEEPAKWIMPLGNLSKLRLEEKAKKRFESYNVRLMDIFDLIEAMEKNQQFLINQLGTIAAEM